MLLRKFNVERTKDTLTIRTVRDGWTGRNISPVEAALFAALAVTSVLRVAGYFLHHENVTVTGLFALELLLVWPISAYRLYFGERVCVLDAGNDQILIDGRKIAPLSRGLSARVGAGFWRGELRLGNDLYLTTDSGPEIFLFPFSKFSGDYGKIESLAAQINTFLAECAVAARRERPAVWSWDNASASSGKAP
ncbi:hypothetical protein CCAX7_56040 [Capsulimonas corticalis]|uniref:Uncharacterized protein n=1 Tax=Capsulimonas corticalis TaxID=2219043 RepID=A0A402D0S5_9BACT|nr:hypothetical protein [Capsulimonas corticalis]BDI33553.1 hypothetical protein CCAX7_56040 [Capsulimonas corticalis]